MLNSKENRSINQLLGITPEETTAESSYLVKKCMQLSNVPISELEVEDYRILINQGIALKYIVPPAIDILSDNLFAEGDYFPGDLLKSILTIDESFWEENAGLKEKLKQICLRDFGSIETLDLSNSIKEELNTLVRAFLSLK